MTTVETNHLVLGGTSGLGLAYARACATGGDHVSIVGRTPQRLQQARRDLLEAGAESVILESTDLANPATRRDILARIERGGYATVFVGGPCPPFGTWDDVSISDLTLAFDICVRYPVEVITCAIHSESPPSRVVVLSSAAADEGLNRHPFFLSGLFRRTLDAWIEAGKESLAALSIDVRVWKPRVVWTPLSRSFAARLQPSPDQLDEAALRRILAQHFNVQAIPDANEYVATMLNRD